MSEHHKQPNRAPTSAAAGARGYKRSWKNLLINKKYQLQFTLFMVGVSAVLMVALGYWVIRVADQTTVVGINLIRSCGDAPSLSKALQEATADSTAAPTAAAVPAAAQPVVDAGSAAGSADADAVGDQADGEDAPRRSRVVMGETSMVVTAIAPPDFVQSVVAHAACELDNAGTKQNLERGRAHILLVLVVAGIALMLGLAIYGIKMTHKVAGPLFKVSLYLTKMRDGRLDKVWNLRKGDQLMAFYEHFKGGHAGLVAMQKADIDVVRAVLADAEAKGLASRSPEVAAQLTELTALLARKEKSLE